MSNNESASSAFLQAFLTRSPTILWGGSGVGKTAAIVALGKEYGYTYDNGLFISLVGSRMEPTDLGFPVARPGERIHFDAPGIFDRILAAGEGIVFIDELNTASPQTEATLLKLFDEGVVGEEKLGPKVWVVAACNPPSIAVGAGGELSLPMRGRAVHFKWSPTPQMWAQGFKDYWGSQEALANTAWTTIRCRISNFILDHPQFFYIQPTPQEDAEMWDAENMNPAWPNPRAWDRLSRLLVGISDRDQASELLLATVGPKPHAAFIKTFVFGKYDWPALFKNTPELIHTLEQIPEDKASNAALEMVAWFRELSSDHKKVVWPAINDSLVILARRNGAAKFTQAAANLAQVRITEPLGMPPSKDFVQMFC